MRSNIAVAKRMVSYAKAHKIDVPDISLTSPVWGKGKQTLAWRISSHAFGKKNAATQKTEHLVRLLFPLSMGEMIRKVAEGVVGVHEEPAGSNSGNRVSQYQGSTGAYHAPWCGSFNKWCIVQAAHALGKAVPRFADNHAYVPDITATIRSGEHGWKQVGFDHAQAGDTVTLWGSGHVESVRYRSGDYLYCVGGNTSPVGQNNHGGMVALTKRHRNEVTVIGRNW
jgi:hypothetical protein